MIIIKIRIIISCFIKLGNILSDKRDPVFFGEAEKLLREAVAGRRKILPFAHPDLIKSVRSLSSLLQEKGIDEEAKSLCEELKLMERHITLKLLSNDNE